MERLREELECSVCYEISVSPIHNCINGHIVCGICVDKVDKCPQCKDNLTLSPFAERLIRRHDIELPCLNSTKGCLKIIKAVDMKEHIKTSCGYRPISCLLLGEDSCYEATLQLEDVYDHLTTKHKIPAVAGVTGYFNNWHLFMSFDGASEGSIVGKKFDGNEFLRRRQLESGVLYFWIVVNGNESVANKYKAVLKFPTMFSNSTTPESKYAQCKWDLPVVPIHDSELSKVIERGQVSYIVCKALLPFCQESEECEDKYKYSWIDSFEIQKV